MLIDLNSLPSEHILEIRYKPTASLLDVRGRLADAVAGATDLKNWYVAPNRIDFRISEADSAPERAFISHANLGYVVRNPETQNYFADRAGKFLHEAIKSRFFDLPLVTRFGIRVQALIGFEGSFQDLLQQITSAFSLDVTRLVPITGDLADIGPVVIVRSGAVNIKVSCGPMDDKQSKEMMPHQRTLPPVGFFVDIDQHESDSGPMSESEVVTRLRAWTRRSWDALEEYEKQILTAPVRR